MAVQMTETDIIAHLTKRLKAEIEDGLGYYKMAEHADCDDNPELCRVILKIMEDEYTHAEFIYDFMREKGYPIPDEISKMYKELCEKMESVTF